MTTIKKLSDYLTDLRIVAGVLATIIGVAVWLTLGWTTLTNRVAATEQTLDERGIIINSISESLETIKIQQAVIGTQVSGIDAKSTETNNLVRELIKFLKK